jgi:hypothetical protein
MELFKLKIEKRNKLYYGKYPYKATLTIVGSAYTYYSQSYEDFCKRIERQKNDLTRVSGYFAQERNNNWVKFLEEVNYTIIKDYFNWRETHKDYVTIRVEGDKVSVFSCDLSLLQTLENINSDVTYTKAVVLKADTLYFKKVPKYKYRTYFKSKRITNEFSQNVIDFADRYKNNEDLKLSPALIKYLSGRNVNRYTYLHGSYFIEYNNESMKSLIFMFFGDMVGKSFNLEKEP